MLCTLLSFVYVAHCGDPEDMKIIMYDDMKIKMWKYDDHYIWQYDVYFMTRFWLDIQEQVG